MPKLELSRDRLLMIRKVLFDHVALGTYPGLVEEIDRALAEPETPAAPAVRNACSEGTCLHEACKARRAERQQDKFLAPRKEKF